MSNDFKLALDESGYKKELDKEDQEKKQKEIEMKNKQFERTNRKVERSFYNGNSMSWGFEK